MLIIICDFMITNPTLYTSFRFLLATFKLILLVFRRIQTSKNKFFFLRLRKNTESTHYSLIYLRSQYFPKTGHRRLKYLSP